MRPEKLRALKQVWLAEPSVETESELIREGLRQGVIFDVNIAVLAMLHHEPSLLAMGSDVNKMVFAEHLLKTREPRDVIDSLGLWDCRVAIMAACGVAYSLYGGRVRAAMNKIAKLTPGEPETIVAARGMLQYNWNRAKGVSDILRASQSKRRHFAVKALRTMSIKMEDQEFFEASWYYILPIAMEGIICA
jgi:hypothetical protein